MRSAARNYWGFLHDHGTSVLALGCVLVIVLRALLPAEWSYVDSTGATIVCVVSLWLNGAVTWLSIAAVISLVGILIFNRDATAWLRLGVAAVAILGFPFTFVANWMLNLDRWTVEAESTSPDGQSYAFLDSSFLQGQRLAIASMTRDVHFWRQFRILVETHGDSPRSWASVIRPAGAPDDYGQLDWTIDGQLLGIRHDHRCYMAFTPATNQSLGAESIEGLSPFVLVGSQTSMHQPDVERIDHDITQRNTGPGIPHEAVLVEASNHPNPEVRKLADRWRAMIATESRK